METYLKNVIERKENGLYLINTPTGSSKSYASVKMIFEKYQTLQEGQHFIFVTNNLNNLPVDDFKKFFGKNYKKNAIQVRSVFDTICLFFESYEECNDHFFIKFKSFEKLKKMYKDYINIQKDFESSTDKANQNYIKVNLDIKHDKLLDLEREFRKDLKAFLISDLKRTEKELSEKNISFNRKLYVKKNYKEVTKMYPYMFLEEYPVILLSTKKMLQIHDTIYSGVYRFLEWQELQNSIIFIDEFDASKSVMTDDILEASLKNHVNLLVTSFHIATQILDAKKNIPEDLKTIIFLNQKKFNSLARHSEHMLNDLHVNLSYICKEIKSRNFLLADSCFYEFFESGINGRAYSFLNDNENIMSIQFAKNKQDLIRKVFSKNNLQLTDSNLSSIFTVARQLSNFIFYSKTFFIALANDYLKQEIVKDDSIDFSQALTSVYSAFKFSADEIMLLEDMDYWHVKWKAEGFLVNDARYYDRGLHLIEFLNRKDERFNTRFDFLDVSTSAEKILLELSRKNVVIGLSATGTIPSVLSNYNLDYLLSRLHDQFHILDGKYFDDLKKQTEEIVQYYENSGIKVLVNRIDQIELPTSSIYEKWKNIFEDEKLAEQLINEINKSFSSLDPVKEKNRRENYMNRYQELFSAFKYVIEHEDINSFLCLTTALPKYNSFLDIKILKDYFEFLKKNKDIELCFLRSGSDFEENKSKVLNELSQGKRRIVCSAYASISAGQNFVYKIPKDIKTIDFMKKNGQFNKKDTRHSKKDFDGIYLGDVTSVMENLFDENISDDEVYKHMLKIQELYENNEISFQRKKQGFNDCFNRLRGDLLYAFQSYKGLPSVSKYILKTVIQAVGRLSRTFNKNPNIYILVSQNLVPNLNFSTLKNQLYSPETIALIEESEKWNSITPVQENFINKAERIAVQSRSVLYEAMRNLFYENDIDQWKRIRELTLKNPGIDHELLSQDDFFSSNYIEKGEGKYNKYYYYQKNTFQEIFVSFSDAKQQAINQIVSRINKKNSNKNILLDFQIHEVSEKNCGLDVLMKNQYIKNYFIEHGYATEFSQFDAMLSPDVYTRVYKAALGEKAVKIILEAYLQVELQDLSPEEYELFDFKTDNAYIDAKHWILSSQQKDQMIQKINAKLQASENPMNKVLIINLLQRNENYTIHRESTIIEIPALLDMEGNVIPEAIMEIKKILKGE